MLDVSSVDTMVDPIVALELKLDNDNVAVTLLLVEKFDELVDRSTTVVSEDDWLLA